MHVCIDARMLWASGIGTYLQNLIPALAQQYQLTLIGDKEELSHYQAHIVPTNIPIYAVAELGRLHRLVPPCDIFWSPHYNVPLLAVPARQRIVTIHDVFHLAFYHTLSFKQKIYARLMLNAAVRLSKHIITVSDFSKSEIIRYTKADAAKIQVIYNGVDLEKFRPVQDTSLLDKIKQKYQLPDKFLLFVGNVKPHKNLISLLQAFARIKEDIDEYALVVVGKKEGFITGDSSLFSFLQQDEDLQKRVIFTGFVADEDLPILYNLAKLFVFPSVYEGFGLPPLEAMACGCPALVSDSASMPEICQDAAWYTQADDIDQIGRQILQAVNLPSLQRQERVNTGITHARHFTWQKAIQQHIQLLAN